MHRLAKLLSTVGTALPLALGLAAVTLSAAPTVAVAAEEAADGIDQIVFPDGRTLEGKILEETETEIIFEGKVAGIPLKTTYQKSELISIKRNVAAAAPAAPAAAPERRGPRVERTPAARPTTRSSSSAATGPVVYHAVLNGWFSQDIHAKPLRDLMNDARSHEPDYIILELDAEWPELQFDDSDEVEIPVGFDQLFYAESIESIFTTEVTRNWSKQPQIVFWVKRAMGGAAFMPFFSDTIYFHPEGKIGGISGLEEQIDGEEAFNEKQISLRLGHAEGMFIARGYDPAYVLAMCREAEVLSYRLEGGEPVLLRRLPENEDEILLTDSGEDGEQDVLLQYVRDETNDFLEFRPEVARQLGVSKGTVSTIDELVLALGINRDRVLEQGSSDRILRGWSRALDQAQRQLPQMWQDYQQLGVNGQNARERRGARGRQVRALEAMIRLQRRFDGALSGPQLGVPGIAQMETMIEQIRLENLGDRD